MGNHVSSYPFSICCTHPPSIQLGSKELRFALTLDKKLVLTTID
jgi:hypothetical protein